MENLDYRFSVIGLIETWLNPSSIDAYGIDGYNHIGITRSNQNGGGVSLFMSNEISYSELTEFTKAQEYIECLFLKIFSHTWLELYIALQTVISNNLLKHWMIYSVKFRIYPAI